MKKELRQDLEAASNELESLISSFTTAELNAVPFEGSWTPAQVVDHILKSQKGIIEVVHGRVSNTDRDPEERILELKKLFLDFNTKMKAPDFILPSNNPLDQDKLIQRTHKAKTGLLESVDTLDLSMMCNDFKFPGSGPLTRIEWLSFILFHTQRHNHQLTNIKQRLKKSTA